ncbi:MAG: PVC-type heme-binding CxxCH protein, partial [Rubripirellula sp.]
MRTTSSFRVLLVALLLLSWVPTIRADSVASDHAKVQALLRIPKATLENYPHQSEVVRRHLHRLLQTSPSEFVAIVDQLDVPGESEALQSIMLDPDSGQAGIDATSLLMRFGHSEVLETALQNSDDQRAAAAATAIGFVNSKDAASLLRPIMVDTKRHSTVRSAAASALGHSWYGQQILLKLARTNQVPEDVRFEISNALLGSWTKEIAKEAKELKSLVSPAAASSEPIPPINKLIQMRGDGKEGKKVFETVGTCSKCHKVRGEGKEVGPDLSEIGSKLSRADLYVNILNPSAAVSHNFETYALLTVDGAVITGILINETEKEVTLRTADAVLKTVPADEVEQLKKQSASLMPADLQKNMSVQNLLDLVDYLVLLKKADETPFHVLASEPSGGQTTVDSRDAADAVGALDVAPGVVAQLFAAEPQMLSPTSIDVDHLGRVWVCEAVNYRHFRNPYNVERTEGDRILVLEDTDGDGNADQSTVFYQGTDIDSPHGICVLGDRVIVSAGDRVISFRDSDGDLKPDEKTLLFTGISGLQHDHGIHSFMPGPDGKLYFNFGNEGKQLLTGDGKPVIDLAGNVVNDSRKPYQQGMVFRCNPDGSDVETLGWNFRNNWEVCIDSFGTLWQSDNDDDGNRGVRINYVMEYGNYGYRDERTGSTWNTKRIGMRDEIGERHWHLNDPGVIPNLLQTGAGSPTGITVYEGDLLPVEWRNQMIHCDPGPNIVRAYLVQNDGAGYQAEMRTLMQGTRDQWFRPVDVCTAPDGSLIVADWYDPGVGGHRMGDSNRGRLFRLTVDAHRQYRVPQ